jgi:large subunit ribosomal protein L30
MSEKKLYVTYAKSVIGAPQSHRATIRALGLKRLGDVAEVPDNPTMRGMINKVSHLVEVKEE